MNTNKELSGWDILTRILIFLLVWVGILHLYHYTLDTGWPTWLDAAAALGATGLFFRNKRFLNWFTNEVQ